MAEKTEGDTESEDELNFESPDFNPLRALRLGNIQVPCPNVKALNNVAQFRSIFGRRAAASQKDAASTSRPIGRGRGSDIPEVGKKKTGRQAPVPAPRPANAPPPPTWDPDDRKHESRHLRNLFTRMEEHDQVGPLSLLKRCVNDKHRVKVWTRSAAYVRGFCQGYIVAYDKHFNIAMIDVDETYRKPIFPTRSKRDVKVFPIDPSNTPDNSDWESDDEDEIIPSIYTVDPSEELHIAFQESTRLTEKDNCDNPLSTSIRKDSSDSRKLDTSSKDSVPSSQKDSSNNIPGSKLPVVCLTSKIEPCLVYNRLKTKVCQRHVNQLFIRGDNVVSVAIAD